MEKIPGTEYERDKVTGLKSGQTALETGLYRSQCCRLEMALREGQKLPPCELCGKATDWDLIQTPERRAP